MFKGGKEKAYVVFDANGADKNNWFDKSRILYTNWNNLSPSATTNYFDIVGQVLFLFITQMPEIYGDTPNEINTGILPSE